MHISIVSVEGDARQSLEAFLRSCGYRLTSPSQAVGRLADIEGAMARPEDKAATFQGGRTTILDREMVLMLEEDALCRLSGEFGSVLTLTCEGISETYGFSAYRNGKKLRSLIVVDGEVAEESGTPLPEEAGFDATHPTEDSTLALVADLGFDFRSFQEAAEFTVFHLMAEEEEDDPGGTPSSKPWWKFW